MSCVVRSAKVSRRLMACLASILLGAVSSALASERIPPNARNQLERGEPISVLVHVAEDAELLPATERQSARTRPELRRAIKARMVEAVTDRNLEAARQYDQLPMLAMRVGSMEALERLAARAEVLEIYENIRLFPILAQSLPLIGQPVASAAGQQGSGTAVAVLDTGVDYTRSEFGSCSAPGVPATCKVVAALDTASDDGARDDNGHGSAVAAVAAAVAPAARIVALDVFEGGGCLQHRRRRGDQLGDRQPQCLRYRRYQHEPG